MPKNSTLEIQNHIKELGGKLGFESAIEERIHEHDNLYAPIYDVVWYLNIDRIFKLNGLEELFKNSTLLFKRLKKLPFAGFEIEGSSTSSKNQLSNFANLYSGDFLYNFVVVNNAAASNENDTYRRGVKIQRYFNMMAGLRNVFFFDKTHIYDSLQKLKKYDSDIMFDSSDWGDRKTFGGEVISADIFKSILNHISNTGLTCKQNWSPDLGKIFFERNKACKVDDDYTKFVLNRKFYFNSDCDIAKDVKNKSDSYYIPKLDMVMGFNAPSGFVEWLKILSNCVGSHNVDYPILFALKQEIMSELFIPLISIEIESSINKHLNGAIFNMAKNSYLGILVTQESADTHLKFFRQELGIKNVTTYKKERM